MMTKEKSKPDPGLKSVGDRLPSYYWLDETKPSKLVEIPKRIAEMAPFSEKISCVSTSLAHGSWHRLMIIGLMPGQARGGRRQAT